MNLRRLLSLLKTVRNYAAIQWRLAKAHARLQVHGIAALPDLFRRGQPHCQIKVALGRDVVYLGCSCGRAFYVDPAGRFTAYAKPVQEIAKTVHVRSTKE